MSNLGSAAGWGLLVGASLLAGALLAARFRLPERAAALVTSFGGGVMLAAIALELVPEADDEAGALLTAAGLIAGALVYVVGDLLLDRDADARKMRRAGHMAAAGRDMDMPKPKKSGEVMRGESIAVGLTVDGVPESLALGLTIAEGEVGVTLLAGIVIGNVVEAYGAAQPILAGGGSRGFAVRLLGGIGLLLAVVVILGGTALSDLSDKIVGTTEAVAAGAVLAVISIAIVPHAFDEVKRDVAIALVLGFIAGYLLS